MAKKLQCALLILRLLCFQFMFAATSQTPLYLFESPAESFKHSLHVASLLHGDDPGVVLLIHPDQEGLLVVVPEENKLRELNNKLSG